MVGAALFLAAAETTRAYAQRPIASWSRGQWQDRTQPPEARLAAAIGWLASATSPAPRSSAVPSTSSPPTNARRPWRPCRGRPPPDPVNRDSCAALRMLHPEEPEPDDDPWAGLL